MSVVATPSSTLTAEQRRIVEWGDGPAVVIAGAGTGKTRVIVERVRHLLETKSGDAPDALIPEQILVLTYNVKAARELQDRLDGVVGIANRSRMTVTNFHSFCQRILTEHAGEAGLPARPDVLDGVAQLLLLREIAPILGLLYHSTGSMMLSLVVQFINRCEEIAVLTGARLEESAVWTRQFSVTRHICSCESLPVRRDWRGGTY